MVRTPSKDKSGLRKGTWTLEEDMKLIAYVTRYGCWNWSLLPKFAGLARCGKSCRLRWLNYLRPDLKRGNFTQEEEDTIIRLHTKLGNRWSVIASNLPGRTDNEIKNHWHTALKKRFQEQKVVTKKEAKLSKLKDYNEPKPQVELIQNKGILPAISRNSVSSSTLSSSNHNFSVLMEDDEFAFLDADRTEQTEIGAENNDSAFFDSHIETMIENFWSEPYKVDMSHIPNEYSSMVNDDDLWSRSNLYDEEHIRLF